MEKYNKAWFMEEIAPNRVKGSIESNYTSY